MFGLEVFLQQISKSTSKIEENHERLPRSYSSEQVILLQGVQSRNTWQKFTIFVYVYAKRVFYLKCSSLSEAYAQLEVTALG